MNDETTWGCLLCPVQHESGSVSPVRPMWTISITRDFAGFAPSELEVRILFYIVMFHVQRLFDLLWCMETVVLNAENCNLPGGPESILCCKNVSADMCQCRETRRIITTALFSVFHVEPGRDVHLRAIQPWQTSSQVQRFGLNCAPAILLGIAKPPLIRFIHVESTW